MTYINKKGIKAALVKTYELDGKYFAVIEIGSKREKREWSDFIKEFNSMARESK